MQWSLLPISVEKELVEDFLMVSCDATDDARGKDEIYYTGSKWLSKKKHSSAAYLLTHC